MRGIEQQFTNLQKGFQELIAQHLLRPFDERELEVNLSAGIELFHAQITFCHSEPNNS